MTRTVVIGATGHVGTYLVPRLVEAGHEVVALSRGQAKPYSPNRAWDAVEQLTMDRAAMEKDGSFRPAIRALKPDIVIDMICFTLDSAKHLTEALSGHVSHFLHTGTIWTHGFSTVVPTLEETPKRPFGEYGTQKAAIESYLLTKARIESFPATLIHPGHIVGPGWAPLNPAGHFNLAAFSTLARGETLVLPNFGLETVHHVHADDVAQMFMGAIANWRASTGESFHAVSSGALTLRGYAEAMSRWFGHEPKLEFLPYDKWAEGQTPEDAEATWEHIARSPNCSIAKAERLLGYAPRYTSLQAVQESVAWLMEKRRIG
ncbi:NAD-dependent epimerase/dehydratase family protein [Rhizobium sp. CNPSo 3464]|uniref:NAD-dependent epimerase/dehydratase family protein n=1 Tax=Rhizobium sp. CNPSo 3464 TaxID=3021406 RepID=UPI00254A4C48|nr:NAD-dependent epimerase/dehydratase family protein [Rhizobium sp. CNPSo 3464]MDK4740026.1 NAD-dependent epimerase/dehydratase family protein [Rhizobium sp. CNPSo 3464]